MKRAYLDSSALRHLLFQHPATATVTGVVTDTDTIAAASAVTVTELHRVGVTVPGVTVQDVDAVLAQVDLIDLTGAQLRAAGLLPSLPSGTQLRSLDAIHVQAALDFGATSFLTSDRRQADAARAALLPVELLA